MEKEWKSGARSRGQIMSVTKKMVLIFVDMSLIENIYYDKFFETLEIIWIHRRYMSLKNFTIKFFINLISVTQNILWFCFLINMSHCVNSVAVM